MSETGNRDAWSPSASNWQRFLSPFRPDSDDIAVVERVARELAGDEPLRVVTLGLTPELVGCAWPKSTRLRAYDTSPGALSRLWPVPGAPADAAAEQASWLDLPAETGSVDMVAADGSLPCLAYPDEVRRVLDEVQRVLKPGGRFVTRIFLRPDAPETLEAILDDLEDGRIANAYVLKMRVDAVLHRDGWAGFSMHEKSRLWRELFPEPAQVAERFGWPAETMIIPGDYSAEDLRFTYPTSGELRSLLAERFEECECTFSNYQLAERCPTLVLAPM